MFSGVESKLNAEDSEVKCWEARREIELRVGEENKIKKFGHRRTRIEDFDFQQVRDEDERPLVIVSPPG